MGQEPTITKNEKQVLTLTRCEGSWYGHMEENTMRKQEFTAVKIGTVRSDGQGMRIELEERYIPGLRTLGDFGHVVVLWWADQCDTEEARNVLEAPSPYKYAPDIMGIFATRSPLRPNPIALSVSGILDIDEKSGTVLLDYIDAEDGTPVLDLKPYTPSIDKIEEPRTPQWCAHWPQNVETSGDFDWAEEFNF